MHSALPFGATLIGSALEDLAHHRWIGFDRDASGVGQAAQLRREHFSFRSDSGPTQIVALRAGVGIAGCHVRIARRDPNLLPVLERAFVFDIEMWLVMHRGAKATRRIRLLFDHPARELTDYVQGDAADF